MADKVLYFPYMSVPQNEWFTRVLLYWDEVGCILPSEYVYNPQMLAPYTRDLLQAKLITPVSPGNYLHQIPEFESSFRQLLEHTQLMPLGGPIDLDRRQTFRIHMEKFSPLIYDLCDMGLAKPRGEPWFEVEKQTADLLMCYLASVLGKTNGLQMEPITDRSESLQLFSGTPQMGSRAIDILRDLRMVILEGILPAPTAEISVSELTKFKEHHSESLSQFRRYIESSLIDIALIPDKDLREEKIRLFRQDLTGQIDHILAAMHERRWPQIMLGTVAAALPLLGRLAEDAPLIATAAATGDVSQILSKLSPMAIAVFSAFVGTRRALEDSQRIRANVLNNPLAYAALARQRFS